MNKQRMLVCVGVVALLAVLAGTLSQAQGPGPEDGGQLEGANSPQAAAYGGIPIQGRLTDADGRPVPDGDYTLTFRLYEDAYGGDPLCEDVDGPPEDPLTPVSVTGGLFSAFVDGCDALVLDGRWLYLGIEVGDDGEMDPRQIIGTVPYAWSLNPGARISGSVPGAAVLYVENSADDGRALRGYATAASGRNFGVVGVSYSPDGYGGLFGNYGGGSYGLAVEDGIRMFDDAGSAQPIEVGDRYRDNAIVAWGKILSGDPGSIQADFGVSSVDHYNTGCYKIYVDATAAGSASLIPMAIAEVDAAPVGAGAMRIASVNQLQPGIFNVYINNGNGQLVDNDFIFMVTAR